MFCVIADLIVLAINQFFDLVETFLGVFPGLNDFLFAGILNTISSFGCPL